MSSPYYDYSLVRKKNSKRIKWTKNMNLNVLRCYFKSLINNSNSYRRSMHRHWKEMYPKSPVSPARLVGQKRNIFDHLKNSRSEDNWLTESDIDNEIYRNPGSQVVPEKFNILKFITVCTTIFLCIYVCKLLLFLE
uniref:Uncharacterized protein n=1 Tax=Octopus bimaculoides TaxID=37653 RepID=A0A0L8IDD7_OCTBM